MAGDHLLQQGLVDGAGRRRSDDEHVRDIETAGFSIVARVAPAGEVGSGGSGIGL